MKRQRTRVVEGGRREARERPLHRELDVQAFVSSGLVYEMGVDSFFGATHEIRPHGERHAHSFRIQAGFVTTQVNDDGMMVGFREVNDLLEAEAKRYAGNFINDIAPFDIIQPTGENIAAVVFRNLDQAIKTLADAPELKHISIWENPTSFIRVQVGT